MKKITLSVLMATVLLTANPTLIKAQASNQEILVSSTFQAETEEANPALLRLDEINSMDKSKMTSLEKKELRKEVKAIKKASRSNGIYISSGLIIIVLLLIILL